MYGVRSRPSQLLMEGWADKGKSFKADYSGISVIDIMLDLHSRTSRIHAVSKAIAKFVSTAQPNYSNAGLEPSLSTRFRAAWQRCQICKGVATNLAAQPRQGCQTQGIGNWLEILV